MELGGDNVDMARVGTTRHTALSMPKKDQGFCTDMDNFNLIELLADVFAKHGPAAAAVEKTYSPGDFSVHFFLQLALILLACRIVGWAGRKFLAQPQVVGEMIAGVLLGPSLFRAAGA